MAQCTYCQTETQLEFGGRPICIKCLERRGERKPPTPEKQVVPKDVKRNE